MAAAGRIAGSIDRRGRAAARPECGPGGALRPSFSSSGSRLSCLDVLPPLPAPDRRRLSHGFRDSVAAEVIPRLRLAHLPVPAGRPENTGASPGDVATLCHLLRQHDQAGATAWVGALTQAGMAPEQLYLGLLAPAARELGRLWEEDFCDFATVTLGTLELRRLLRDYAADFLRDAPAGTAAHTVLLAPVPGEQHTFGLDMVAGFFRRSGWYARCAPVRSAEELLSLLRRESFSIVGLSVGSTDRLDNLAALIRRIRRASRNRAIGVMVGGPAFNEHPDQAAQVGADATAADARQAPLQAERLLTLRA